MPARPKLAANTLGLAPTLDAWGGLRQVRLWHAEGTSRLHSVRQETAEMPFRQLMAHAAHKVNTYYVIHRVLGSTSFSQ